MKNCKHPQVLLNLPNIHQSLLEVEESWQEIDDQLDILGIGRKDSPFNKDLRERMEMAYIYLNELLIKHEKPLSDNNLAEILELNNIVHYGHDQKLRREYKKAISINADRFYKRIEIIQKWYQRHKSLGNDPIKIAAKVYISILATPQLFTEGNHRTGSLVTDWILLDQGYPPFVLSKENAIAYFYPSSQIKRFIDQATWRGKFRLPEWHKKYGEFLNQYINQKYLE